MPNSLINSASDPCLSLIFSINSFALFLTLSTNPDFSRIGVLATLVPLIVSSSIA
jgi:hypothetical protein